MSSNMKFCINCKHRTDLQMCGRPRPQIAHMVYGMIDDPPHYCIDERMDDELCGRLARFFEEKAS